MAVGRAKASNLGVGYLAGTRDNKSVAEIGEKYHLQEIVGALCNEGSLGQQT